MLLVLLAAEFLKTKIPDSYRRETTKMENMSVWLFDDFLKVSQEKMNRMAE